MDQWGDRIGLALIGLAVGAVIALAERHICSSTGWWAWPLVMAGSSAWAWSLQRVHAALRRPGALAFLHCCAAAAVYACVPETDQMKGIGLLVGGVLLLEVVAGERLPLGWHGAVAAAVVWAGVFGSSGRGSALIGATFAVWPILLPALFGASAVVCMLGVAGAWLSSRTGAIQPDTASAVVGAAAWGGATAVGAVLVWFRVGRRSSPSA